MMYIPDNLDIRNIDIGKGLFSLIDLKFNNIIAKEENYFIDKRDKVGKFSIQISEDLFLDHINHPHYLDFINHSCDPNIRFDVKSYLFYAIKDISKDTELTYDYETTESDLIINNEDFKCKCGSSNCRGDIVGYGDK